MDDQSKRTATTVVHRVRPGQPATPNRPAGAEVLRNSDLQLQRKLLAAVSESKKKPIAIKLVLATIREVLAPAFVVYLDRDDAQLISVSSDSDLLERLPPGASNKLLQWANKTCQSGSVEINQLSGANQWNVATVPVVLRGRPPEVLCAIFQKDAVDDNRVVGTLQLGSSHLTLWHSLRDEQRARSESKNTSALLELLGELDNSESVAAACYILVNDLREYLGCGRIAIGLSRSGKVDCKLAAVSGLSDFDKRSEYTEQLEAVLNEVILRDKITVLSTKSSDLSEGTLAHQNLLAGKNAKTLVSAPLYSNSREVVGAWLFLDDKPEFELTETLHFVRASQAVVGSRLAMLRRAHVHPLLRPLRTVTQASKSRKLVGGLVAVLLFIGTMLVPMDYRIGCDCQLEPVSRRFVAAPYDGTLEESLVEAGEIVTAGQILARMDARELRWEMSGHQADYNSEKKKRDAASARDEVALAQQSDLEMQRLSLKMQLLRHRLENLEIKSPVDGVVIDGDLKKAEGVPLTIGQTMFEIGPLDEMIVEIAVPESDILHVAQGMQVEVRLDADQSLLKTGSIVRLTPRSETSENKNVFIAEVALDNIDGSLRPGMKGSAKVIGEPHSLGWNLFHKAWESFAMMVGC